MELKYLERVLDLFVVDDVLVWVEVEDLPQLVGDFELQSLISPLLDPDLQIDRGVSDGESDSDYPQIVELLT